MEFLTFLTNECMSQDSLRRAAVTENRKLSVAFNSNTLFLHSFCILSLVSRGSEPCSLHSSPI